MATVRSEIPRGDTDPSKDIMPVADIAPPITLSSGDPEAPRVIEQSKGVTRIEALYTVFGKGWKIWLLYISIGLIAYIYSLSSNTTGAYLPFATSTFDSHTSLGTISVITSVMASVSKPFMAKIADRTSRPFALLLSVIFYCLGYIAVAASKRVSDVAGGEVLYTIGNTGIQFLKTVLVADITPLKWRGFFQALDQSPPIVNAFVAGYISDGISAFSADGWRWGYGMFVIMVPILIAPAITILFWADNRAKKLTAFTDEQQGEVVRRSLPFKVVHFAKQIDVVGLVLLGFAFSLILAPFTLSKMAKGGYNNPSLIAMLVVGGVLLIAFGYWELKVAAHPIMPLRVLNRTMICVTVIDFCFFMSNFLQQIYFLSFIFVVKDWSARDYQFFANTETVALAVFAFIPGIYQRIFHRYKYMQIFGLCVRCIGCGLFYYSSYNRSDALVIFCQIICPFGSIMSSIASATSAAASVPHEDMALAMALLGVWTRIGGAVGAAIAASVWNSHLPHNLQKYLGDTHSPAELAKIFGSIKVARVTEPRNLVLDAYYDSIRPLYLGALVCSFGPLIASLFTTNFYLGDSQNAIETDKVVRLQKAAPGEIALEKKAEEEERETSA